MILTRFLHKNVAGNSRLIILPPKQQQQQQQTFTAEASVSDESSTPCYSCHVHSSLSSGLLDYSRGWAWQQTLLSRRLEVRRTTCRPQDTVNDADCVLMFQLYPVYTLGRGADEMYLTFLQQEHAVKERERLARSNRGVGSARLSVDRRMDSDLLTRPLSEAVDALAGVFHYSWRCHLCVIVSYYSPLHYFTVQTFLFQSWRQMEFPFIE